MYFTEFWWVFVFCFFFKQKTAYEMRISDWSSDVCSSDLPDPANQRAGADRRLRRRANRCSGRNTHKLKSGREMMMLAEQDFYAALEAGRKPTGSGQHPFSIIWANGGL